MSTRAPIASTPRSIGDIACLVAVLSVLAFGGCYDWSELQPLPGGDDLGSSTGPGATPDLSSSTRDLAPAADRADLGTTGDLAATNDLAVTADLATTDDLAVTEDLAATDDLALGDLAREADLVPGTPGDDLAPPPDLASGPDLAHCAPGYADCDLDPRNGCETQIAVDVNNCGACAVVCSGNHVIAPSCSAGQCNSRCQAGWLDCNQDVQRDGCEVNAMTDPSNCGGCGAACSRAGLVAALCSMGQCAGLCATGFADCDMNLRVDGCETAIASDPANCGGCGVACSSNHVARLGCGGGVCNGDCAAGWADCNGDKRSDGCEVLVGGSDANNCGGCGLTCSGNNVQNAVCSGMTCVGPCGGGACNGTCKGGFADCNMNMQKDGCETHLDNDPANCGACGVACSSNHVTPGCGGGQCNGTCAPGYGDCDMNKLTNGCEVSLATDPLHCGDCNRVCSTNNIANPTCQNATCNGACNPGFLDCNNNKQGDGCEVNGQTDVKNCGSCGTDCSKVGMDVCNQGSCRCAVPTDCDPNLADTCAAGACVCGRYGTFCNAATSRCSQGTCRLLRMQPCTQSKDCFSNVCTNGMCM